MHDYGPGIRELFEICDYILFRQQMKCTWRMERDVRELRDVNPGGCANERLEFGLAQSRYLESRQSRIFPLQRNASLVVTFR